MPPYDGCINVETDWTNQSKHLGSVKLDRAFHPDEALTEDEEKVVAAFQDYHTAKEARRAHVKRSMPIIPTTFVGKLQKHGK